MKDRSGMERFSGKIVLVTGATSGIGRASAKMFSEEGAEVILVGRNVKRGNSICSEISQAGGKCKFIKCDLQSPKEVESLADEIESRYGKIDTLFSNAGVFITQSLDEISLEDWNTSFAINTTSHMWLVKHIIPMLEKAGGSIIFNASVSGLQSWTSGRKNYLYGASKAALIKFANLCALNYAGKVRVNTICPGIVDTDIFTNKDFSRFDGVIPIGYIAKPEDIAKVVLFLASDDASYVTGATIPIDGGMSL